MSDSAAPKIDVARENGKFLSASLESIAVDIKLPYSLYLSIDQKLVKFRNVGDTLTPERQKALSDRKVDTVYIERQEWQTYIGGLEASLDQQGIARGNEKAAMGLRNALGAYLQLVLAGDEVTKASFSKAEDLSAKLPIAIGQSRELAHKLLRRSTDPAMYFSNHAVNVAIYASAVGLKMRMTGQELQDLVLAATFANIGVIKIPRQILYKPGPLTQDEWKIIRQHPQYGKEILGALLVKPKIQEVVLQHHERFDGGGYPAGLMGQKIQLFARITTIAECYSAMTSNRPWKAASSPHEAVSMMQSTQGKFDNSLFSLLIEK